MKKLTNDSGSRIATITPRADGRFDVYVGFAGDASCPGEETIPARFFRGTCSNNYASAKAAEKAAARFLNE